MAAQHFEHSSAAYNEYDYVFERNYHAAVAYYQAHGNLECPNGFVDNQGIRLYDWFNHLRVQFKKHGRSFLTEEQFRLLDAIGMRWLSKHDVQWEDFFNRLAAYQKRTGSADVAATYKDDGVPLGRWYRRQKELYTAGELRKDRAERLLALGCNLRIEGAWERHYHAVREYAERGSIAEIPPDLMKWLKRQMCCMKKGTLSEDRAKKLLAIGMIEDMYENGTQHSSLCVNNGAQAGSAVNN